MESSYTYGDDGIPVIVDDSSNPSSPVSAKPPKVKKNKKGKASGGEKQKGKGSKHEEDSKAVFTIDSEGYDVTLSESRGKLLWTNMNALGRRKKSGKLSGIFRGRRPSLTEDTVSEGLALDSIFGIQVKRRQRPGDKEDEGMCMGLVISTSENKDANTIREKTIFMEHPSSDLCTDWKNRIMKYIQDVHHRPTSIKLFLQPHAGSKTGRNVYTRTVLPIFQAAGVSVDVAEVMHNEFIKQEFSHMNMEDYDCIVCMGGDGTVSQLVDAMLNKSQRDRDVDMKKQQQPVRCPVPLGIIPTGRTNNTAQSVMGVADPVTAAIHIVQGNFRHVDVCSISTPDKFLGWGFNSQYGFAGQVLTFMRRYKALGSKRVDAAFIKALTKAKLRAYECDIEYILADSSSKVKDTICRTGCQVCQTPDKENDGDGLVSDLVQELDPLNQSFTSNASSVIDLPEDSPWRSIKGKYMNVGLFAIPGLSDLAPQGLHRYSHLCTGIIDLVLVKETDKKEYVRHLRRHGNMKDPFDFPFIERHKVKELRFRPRFPMSWNYNDHDFNEIQYQMERAGSKATTQKSMEVIADMDSDDGMQRAQSICTLDMSDDEEEDEDGDEKKENGGETPEPTRLVGPQYRKTFYEMEIARRKKIARKKEEKQKARAEEKMVAIWNIDNQMVKNLELDFKIHQGLIRICGFGVSPHTSYGDVRHGCLSGM